jgi:hypothetical protein
MLLAYNSHGQLKCAGKLGDDANKYPKPFMWSENDSKLIERFNKKKLRLINDYTGLSQPSSFILGNFLGMIEYFNTTYKNDFEYLNIYIVAYSSGGDLVPEDYENLLTLLFAPAKGKTDLDYFTIPPETPFDESKIDQFKIDLGKYPDLPKEWRRNFVNKIIPALYKTIDDKEPGNYHHDNLADSKRITYCAKDIFELACEQKYKHTDNSNNEIKFSTDMLASFAAFGNNGNPRAVNFKAKRRLFIQFDFLTLDKKPFYLENTKGFKGRTPPATTCLSDKELNNGQLCPPSTNCPDN